MRIVEAQENCILRELHYSVHSKRRYNQQYFSSPLINSAFYLQVENVDN